MTAKQPMYTNAVTPELLQTIDKVFFAPLPPGPVCDEALAVMERNRAFAQAHPPVGIHRVATEGSQTRNGGVLNTATTLAEITLPDGRYVQAAQPGDEVVYPDGSTAQIVADESRQNNSWAVVGSRLSNGDEIINTPQSVVFIVQRSGVPLTDQLWVEEQAKA